MRRRDLRQHVNAADVTAMLEVSGIHRVDDGFAFFVRCEGDQLMGEQRIGGTFDLLKVERQSGALSHHAWGGKPLFQRDLPTAFGRHVIAEGIAVCGDVGIQEKGVILDGHRLAVPLRQCCLKVLLADTTPGAGGIVIEVDLHHFAGSPVFSNAI